MQNLENTGMKFKEESETNKDIQKDDYLQQHVLQSVQFVLTIT